jgi:hypothetical protein
MIAAPDAIPALGEREAEEAMAMTDSVAGARVRAGAVGRLISKT